VARTEIAMQTAIGHRLPPAGFVGVAGFGL